jgi:hypothetical protein
MCVFQKEELSGFQLECLSIDMLSVIHYSKPLSIGTNCRCQQHLLSWVKQGTENSNFVLVRLAKSVKKKEALLRLQMRMKTSQVI